MKTLNYRYKNNRIIYDWTKYKYGSKRIFVFLLNMMYWARNSLDIKFLWSEKFRFKSFFGRQNLGRVKHIYDFELSYPLLKKNKLGWNLVWCMWVGSNVCRIPWGKRYEHTGAMQPSSPFWILKSHLAAVTETLATHDKPFSPLTILTRVLPILHFKVLAWTHIPWLLCKFVFFWLQIFFLSL